MSTTDDEFAVEAINPATGAIEHAPDAAPEDADTRVTRKATPAAAGRVPLTVMALVTQWSKLGRDQRDLALLCYDQLSVRLAAGWPDWASQFGQISMDDVVDALTRAQQVLAERAGRHRRTQEQGAPEQATADWLQVWAERLARAGWMPIGDQSPEAVAYAIGAALIDCDQARKLAPSAGPAVVSGILKIFV